MNQKTITSIENNKTAKESRIAEEKGFVAAPVPANNVWAERKQKTAPPRRTYAPQHEGEEEERKKYR